MNEDEIELSEQTIKEIQKSREEYKKGSFYSFEEVKKEMNRK
jgi:hypothetical protein